MNQKRNNDELLTTVFGSKEVLEPAPTDVIPQGMMRPEIAYQIVKDETYPQTQPRLNLATFVTTYMDEYATRLMNEAISVNYIDETEYPRIAVMNGRCINMIANLWNTPEKAQWKAGALGIGSSEACMLGGVAAWLRWRKRRQAAGKPFDKPNLVMSAGFQVVWEKFCQLWQIELRTVPLTLKNPTLDPEQALAMCDENTICIVPIAGVTWTGLDDDIQGLDKAPDEDNAKTLILRLAAEQYAALGNEEYETNRLRRLFSAFECVAELNADLLKNTVSEVLVTRQNVKLRLKNGQIIERSDLQ